MTVSCSLKHRIFHNYKIILIMFVAYGLVAGSIAYVWRLSSGEQFSSAYFYTNMPAMLILGFIEVSFGNPLSFLAPFPAALIPLYATLWLVIGLAVYGLVRMLRLGSSRRSPFSCSVLCRFLLCLRLALSQFIRLVLQEPSMAYSHSRSIEQRLRQNYDILMAVAGIAILPMIGSVESYTAAMYTSVYSGWATISIILAAFSFVMTGLITRICRYVLGSGLG